VIRSAAWFGTGANMAVAITRRNMSMGDQCSTEGITSLWPLRSSPAHTVIMTRGGRIFFNSLRSRRFGGLRVAAALHQDVEHHPGPADRALQPVPCPRGRHRDLIAMPLVACGRQPAADLVGKALPQPQRPLQHGLVPDDDAAYGQQFVHHP